MAELKIDMAPAGWQVTATTIDCDKVHEYVTILVHKDWSSSCTWCTKYRQKAAHGLVRRFSRSAREQMMKCNGPDCEKVIAYRDNLIKEEKSV